jgi:hypothetical protein
MCLCAKHHRYSFQLSAHKNPVAFIAWLQAEMPDRWAWLVQALGSTPPPTTHKDAYLALNTPEA